MNSLEGVIGLLVKLIIVLVLLYVFVLVVRMIV
jgi:hypothetical protein